MGGLHPQKRHSDARIIDKLHIEERPDTTQRLSPLKAFLSKAVYDFYTLRTFSRNLSTLLNLHHRHLCRAVDYRFGLEHHLPFHLLEEIRKAKYPTKAKTSDGFHLCSKNSFIQYGRKPFLWDGLDHRHRMAWTKLVQAWFSFVG